MRFKVRYNRTLFEDYSHLQAYGDDLVLYYRVSLAMYNFEQRKQLNILPNLDTANRTDKTCNGLRLL